MVLVADPDLRDLSTYRTRRLIRAAKGGHGSGSGRHGATGADAELRVPVGTQVRDAEVKMVADLVRPGARVVVAKGGEAGRETGILPRRPARLRASPRSDCRARRSRLELRLKLLADAALVGMPNAGKSSLLRRISNARPKVADYPFTTLQPSLGTVDSPDGRQLVVADIPGLIEGAADGAGLGHEFLAHLERARVLVHVIDSAAGDSGYQFRAVDRQLVAYGAGLDLLPQIVVLNKIDIFHSPSFQIEDPRIVASSPSPAPRGRG